MTVGKFRVPTRLQRSVDIMTITIRAKPFTDSEELLPMCYRCGLNNPMTSESTCVHCKTPFMFCYSTFGIQIWISRKDHTFSDILPLVEFYISDDISKEEALELIDAEPPLSDSIFNPFHGKVEEIISRFKNLFKGIEQATSMKFCKYLFQTLEERS